MAVGHWLANLRKTGGLGKDEERATERREALECIDPYWNPTWPLAWQQRHAALTVVLADGATLAEILPGVTVDGQDIGTWLHTQRTGWEQLSQEQREHLTELGVQPPPTAEKEAPAKPAKARKGASAAFERGLAALAQYKHREGHVKVPRAHTETVVLDDQEHTVNLGVFLSNTKSRRSKLTTDKLTALAEHGLEWAAT
ncbi:helicase associated domain-containing protein [Streptomyces noursei]